MRSGRSRSSIDFITDRRKRQPRSARVPLQPLRANVDRSTHRAARDTRRGRRSPDGPLRHARGRGRRPLPARRIRRPVSRRPPGNSRGCRELLHQAPGATWSGYERRVDSARRDDPPHRVRGRPWTKGRPRTRERDQRVVAGYNEDDCRATLRSATGWRSDGAELEASMGSPLTRPVAEDGKGARRPRDRTPEARTGSRMFPTTPPGARTRTKPRRYSAICSSGIGARPSQRGGALSAQRAVECRAGRRSRSDRRTPVRRSRRARQAIGRASGSPSRRRSTDSTSGTWSATPPREDLDGVRPRRGTGFVDLRSATIRRTRCRRTSSKGPGWDRGARCPASRPGERVVREGISGADPATALLLRRRPAADDRQEGPLHGDARGAGRSRASSDPRPAGFLLADPGPSGTGKTYTAARAILALTALGGP